jgi:hypothetical protein
LFNSGCPDEEDAEAQLDVIQKDPAKAAEKEINRNLHQNTLF